MATKVSKTRLQLPENVRGEIVALLNARLADTVDYALQLKQAHWNVKGREFVALHEMFDSMATELQEHADLIAERAVQLGGQAHGTLQSAVAHTTLPEYPLEARGAVEHLSALAERLAVLATAVRAAIDTADGRGDKDTADLFTEVSRGLDKQMWYLEAHLAD
ncbi:MAG TPA: DNA starvation/stationary phase protection protein Dps [Candidatus Krumholzibacteria bacterium]|jgi:starvation-inducible DNA-binding protein|nr:DNA starvation/stationary phase protection protein Dps [Candidatus Krumholzibacteria bacterium]